MSDTKEKKQIILPENMQVDYTFEKMLKTFMKQVDKEGILKEYKRRRYYEKPSTLKRTLENERRRRNKTGKNQKRRKNK